MVDIAFQTASENLATSRRLKAILPPLRGVVMPVIDLGRRLGLSPMIPQDRNVIIVSQTRSGPVGLLVEAVCETLIVQTSKI